MNKNEAFCCPPLELQGVFASRVAEVESIQVQQSAATAKAQETFDALLGQVFSGSRTQS
jgi:hypothetical protein